MAYVEIANSEIDAYSPITGRLFTKYSNNRIAAFGTRRYQLFYDSSHGVYGESLSAVSSVRARVVWPSPSGDEAAAWIYVPEHIVTGMTSVDLVLKATAQGAADYTFRVEVNGTSSNVVTAADTLSLDADFSVSLTGLTGNEYIEVELYAVKDNALSTETATLNINRVGSYMVGVP